MLNAISVDLEVHQHIVGSIDYYCYHYDYRYNCNNDLLFSRHIQDLTICNVSELFKSTYNFFYNAVLDESDAS
jgi:hypothetical protein